MQCMYRVQRWRDLAAAQCSTVGFLMVSCICCCAAAAAAAAWLHVIAAFLHCWRQLMWQSITCFCILRYCSAHLRGHRVHARPRDRHTQGARPGGAHRAHAAHAALRQVGVTAGGDAGIRNGTVATNSCVACSSRDGWVVTGGAAPGLISAYAVL